MERSLLDLSSLVARVVPSQAKIQRFFDGEILLIKTLFLLLLLYRVVCVRWFPGYNFRVHAIEEDHSQMYRDGQDMPRERSNKLGISIGRSFLISATVRPGLNLVFPLVRCFACFSARIDGVLRTNLSSRNHAIMRSVTNWSEVRRFILFVLTTRSLSASSIYRGLCVCYGPWYPIALAQVICSPNKRKMEYCWWPTLRDGQDGVFTTCWFFRTVPSPPGMYRTFNFFLVIWQLVVSNRFLFSRK